MQASWCECLFSNRVDATAFNTSASEGSLLTGLNEQPVFPAGFWDQGGRGFGKAVTIQAMGILGTTGTPTYIYQLRLGTTAGASYLSGTSLGISAAITTGSGVSNKFWILSHTFCCNTPGIGSGNTTLSGAGYVMSPTGFASPLIYPLEPTTPDTATWTLTIDNSVTQYLNVSVTPSASSASNTHTLKQLVVWVWN